MQCIANEIMNIMEKASIDGKTITIKMINENKNGFSNHIAFLDLSYQEGAVCVSKEVVFRKNLNMSDREKYNKEVGIMTDPWLNQTISIPLLLFKDNENQTMIMERIHGMTLDQYCILKPSSKIYWLREFGRTLGCIHGSRGDLCSERLDLDDLLAALQSRVKSYEPIFIEVLDQIKMRLSKVKLDPVLCHNDYHFMNAIVSDTDELYVLDWEKASISDYRMDISRTIILCNSWFDVDTDFEGHFIDGYEAITGKKISDLEVFKSLLSFDLLTRAIKVVYEGAGEHIRDKTYKWLRIRYELFVRYNGVRIGGFEDFLKSNGSV